MTETTEEERKLMEIIGPHASGSYWRDRGPRLLADYKKLEKAYETLRVQNLPTTKAGVLDITLPPGTRKKDGKWEPPLSQVKENPQHGDEALRGWNAAVEACAASLDFIRSKHGDSWMPKDTRPSQVRQHIRTLFRKLSSE
jgi:hypothetical protein